MDESRLLTTRAPILDEEIEMVIALAKEVPNVAALRDDFRTEKEKWYTAQEKAVKIGDPQTLAAISQMEEEGMLQEIESSLAVAANDPDEAQKCQNRLLDLKSVRAKIEDTLEWPTLQSQADDRLREMMAVVQESRSAPHQQKAVVLERETRQALAAKDAHLLRQKLIEVDSLTLSLLWQQPAFCIGVFQDLERRNFLGEAWRKRRYLAAFISKLSDSECEAAETQVWIELQLSAATSNAIGPRLGIEPTTGFLRRWWE